MNVHGQMEHAHNYHVVKFIYNLYVHLHIVVHGQMVVVKILMEIVQH